MAKQLTTSIVEKRKRAPRNTGPFQCPIQGCVKRFSRASDVNRHVKGPQHDPGARNRYTCEGCGYGASQKSNLKFHRVQCQAHLDRMKHPASAPYPVAGPSTLRLPSPPRPLYSIVPPPTHIRPYGHGTSPSEYSILRTMEQAVPLSSRLHHNSAPASSPPPKTEHHSPEPYVAERSVVAAPSHLLGYTTPEDKSQVFHQVQYDDSPTTPFPPTLLSPLFNLDDDFLWTAFLSGDSSGSSITGSSPYQSSMSGSSMWPTPDHGEYVVDSSVPLPISPPILYCDPRDTVYFPDTLY